VKNVRKSQVAGGDFFDSLCSVYVIFVWFERSR